MSDANSPHSLLAAAQKTFTEPFGAVISLSPEGGDETIHIDGRQNPPAVSIAKAGAKTDCSWRAAPDILLRAISGERSFESVYVSGQLSISGDMSVMARLNLKQAK
jgi:putative sterol carrier protein